MNFLVQRIVFSISAASKQFEVVKGKYLIPVKPSRALSSYIIYSNDLRKVQTGSATDIAKILGQKWKNLDEQKKKSYEQIAKQLKQKHDAQMKVYNEKYVQPLKKINLSNLMMKRIFSQQKIPSIGEAGKILKQKMYKLTAQERKALEDQVNKIKLQKQKISEQFSIPQLEFKTQRAFLIREAGDKKLSQLTQIQKNNFKHKYIKYLENYQKQLLKFVSRFNLTLHDFNEIIKSQKRKQKRLTKNPIQGLEEILKKTTDNLKKATTKVASTKSKPISATRVKKPITIKKSPKAPQIKTETKTEPKTEPKTA